MEQNYYKKIMERKKSYDTFSSKSEVIKIKKARYAVWVQINQNCVQYVM